MFFSWKYLNNRIGKKIQLIGDDIFVTNEMTKKINNSEKKILTEMISNPGKIYSREEIRKISGINQERSIDVMITRLRQKIEIKPKNPKFLQ